MWNFLEFLWVLSGGFVAYYAIKDCMDKKGSISAYDAAMTAAVFFGGIISLIYLISTEGDKIVLFKKPDNKPTGQAPTASYVNQDPTPAPAPAPVRATKKQGSVLDG